MNKMMTMKWKLTKNQKGMTLIELMAVVVILGILAAVAGAAVVGGFDKAKTSADVSSKKVISDAAQRYILDNQPADTALAGIGVSDLVTGGYLKEQPKDAAGKFFKLEITKTSGVYTYTVTEGQAAAQP